MNFKEPPVNFKFSPNYSFIFPFEENFDKEAHREWMTNNWHWVIYFCAAYVVAVFGGQALMKSRTRYELRYPLAAWNFLLAIFSIMGTLRTMPEFVHVLTNYGFHFSACNRSYADFNPISGFWGWMFVMSKVPEFIDTAFIVLRKQKLIFLHWYHHLATALVLWFGYTDHSSLARWTIVMNYSVHGIMYSYFALRAARVHVPRWIAMFITTSQISQMFIGIFVTIHVQRTLWQGQRCDVSYYVLYSTMLLYLSYFILFVNFFVHAYLVKKSPVVPSAKPRMEINHNDILSVHQNGHSLKQNGHSLKQNGHSLQQNGHSLSKKLH